MVAGGGGGSDGEDDNDGNKVVCGDNSPGEEDGMVEAGGFTGRELVVVSTGGEGGDDGEAVGAGVGGVTMGRGTGG